MFSGTNSIAIVRWRHTKIIAYRNYIIGLKEQRSKGIKKADKIGSNLLLGLSMLKRS